MDLSLVPGSHEFSSFTNATRVTPREKQPKSYMFILDTPDQSEHEGSVKVRLIFFKKKKQRLKNLQESQ